VVAGLNDMGFIAALNLPLAFGAASVMLDPIDWVTAPALFLRAISRYRGTLAWNPNFAYAFMAQTIREADLEGVDLSSVRAMVNCSEPVTFASQQQFARRFAACGFSPEAFRGCYAMAETTFAVTDGSSLDAGYLDPAGPLQTGLPDTGLPMVSVGRALPGVDLRIVDAQGAPLPERHVGEILIRAPFLFDGYFENAEATSAAIRDGWYRSGDIGYHLAGELFVCGRAKDVIIVAGVNFFPQDLEAAASGCPGAIPGRAVAFAGFDEAMQTERITILVESDAPSAEHIRLERDIRQRILAAFQLANFGSTKYITVASVSAR
jgi:fatty-acyl-CoA synthase